MTTRSSRTLHTAAARLLLLLCVGAVGLAGCEEWKPQPIAAGNFVGDRSCISCHQDKQSYLETAHHLTSSLPTRSSIRGSFAEGENVLTTVNPYLHFQIVAEEDGFYQRAVLESPADSMVISKRMDLVVGSGRKGQSYLYWESDRLFQLPVSYWRGLGWAISPGYRDGVVNFDRAINPRCLECHSTYFQSPPEAEASNQYETSTYILGISCESCHGGGREHVERQSSRVQRLRGEAIVNPAELPRERQVELCALCHGGIGESVQPPFSYTPGEPLEEFLRQREPLPGEAVDVHGNQVALLRQSPCFQGSQMTCSTCHDVHRPQRNVAEFSAACTSCHTPGDAIPATHGREMPGNCVDCHMPELPTAAIISTNEGRRVRPHVRTHWIRVYPDAPGPGTSAAQPLPRASPRITGR